MGTRQAILNQVRPRVPASFCTRPMSLRTLRERFRDWRRPARQRAFLRQATAPMPSGGGSVPLRILVVGIYLSERAHRSQQLIEAYGATAHQVDQLWVAIGNGPMPEAQAPFAHLRWSEKAPKFVILNRVLAKRDLDVYDYVLISDDDIVLCRGFVDAYLAWIAHCKFSIAQPARARHSFKDHRFALQRRWIKARQTRFVEIGPVVSFDRAARRCLLPFDESSPMGWGYDFVWPVIAQDQGLRMGIVDATPVDHSFRPQSATYSRDANREVAERYLQTHAHLPRCDALRILHSYR